MFHGVAVSVFIKQRLIRLWKESWRNQLKKNFLRENIIRMDCQGVLLAEMEKFNEVKPYFNKKAFNRYNEKINNRANLFYDTGINMSLLYFLTVSINLHVGEGMS